MSPRVRVFVVVCVAAAAAASAVVGVALVQRDDGADRETRPSGRPPVALELGVRADPEARALRRAARLYASGRHDEAARIFGRYDSVDAQVAAAMARWPNGTLAALARLEGEYPRRALVRLHLGLARFWAGERTAAVAAWRAARRVEPDTPSAVRADDLLHPRSARGRPEFVTSFRAPRALQGLRPDRQLAALARRARNGGVHPKLLYGVALQRLERPLSARRQFDAAVAIAPDDPEAATAAAVGRFDKARPQAAFARLGPLTRRFPHAATVRFHLGLLLLWIGDIDGARRQLRLARDVDPGAPLSREAARVLRRLANIRVNRNGD